MTGTIELDRDGRHLVISFPYRQDLVEQVRDLPGRRWDRGSKTWRVPAEHTEVVVNTFMSHGFEVAPEVAGILAGTTAIAAKPVEKKKKKAEDKPSDETGPLTVLVLNERVRDAIAGAFPGRVQVVGEVLDFDKNQDRQHIFFTLVEKAPGGRKMAAKVDVALFERTAKRVLPGLDLKGMALRDGLEILIEARVDLYPASGRFQLIIEDIRPEFTLGKLAISREQILTELRERDLLETNALKAAPIPSLRIGVLASPDSDGWNDFRKQLEQSGIGFQVGLCPVRVQGPELQPTMLRGLTWFAEHAADYDVLCILRGGGSRTDLAWFDDREVALAVAQHPLKILCGIGHERDVSVLDEITHSEKTPTAVAAFLVGEVERAREQLQTNCRRLVETALAATASQQRQLTQSGQRLNWAIQARLSTERADLRAVGSRLTRAAKSRCQHEHQRLDGHATRQRLLDPKLVLRRGYTLVRAANGHILTSVTQLGPGDRADVVFRDGRVTTRVEQIESTLESSE